ncbi:phosphatase 2C-like domain-containing protein [Crucibulum laeve]|uniref:Phosphatase 2C-like domain-containing protein n=1 Tax=Crucibulum laeve TaxID=68775 RepID=A0A5C3LRE6_9AGAR|nr:phosphatase 2C-like domain-containing protein [Crucibulum laeve]
MFNRFPKLAYRYSSANAFNRRATATLAVGILGTACYGYTRRVIHGDSSAGHSDDNADNADYRWLSQTHKDILRTNSRTSDDYPWHPVSEYWANLGKSSGIILCDTAFVTTGYWGDSFHCLTENKNGASDWTVLAGFDSINGPGAHLFLSYNLLATILDNLHDTLKLFLLSDDERKKSSPVERTSESYSEALDRTIKESFLQVDQGLLKDGLDSVFSSSSKAPSIQHLARAFTGSSTLLAFYDSTPRTLKIANVGDGRAVLGRCIRHKDGSQSYEVHVLTREQTVEDPDERKRLDAIYVDPTLKAWFETLERPISRAFGLAALKWSREVQERLHNEYLGDEPLYAHNPKTSGPPPYLTAEPEITTISVKPGDFLVMGSYGLWKSLTSEEAVGLVGLWIERGMLDAPRLTRAYTTDRSGLSKTENNDPAPYTPIPLYVAPYPAPRPADLTFQREDLPVLLTLNELSSIHAEDNTAMFPKTEFLCVDSNAATHLVRNAMGGADRDLTEALTLMHTPRAKRFRNKINATVVLFDDKALTRQSVR